MNIFGKMDCDHYIKMNLRIFRVNLMYFSRTKFEIHLIQKSFDVATKRKLVTRRFKSQMRSYLKYNYQIINFNKPFAHGLRSCKNVHYHVNQISKNRKWIIFQFWVRHENPRDI